MRDDFTVVGMVLVTLSMIGVMGTFLGGMMLESVVFAICAGLLSILTLTVGFLLVLF